MILASDNTASIENFYGSEFLSTLCQPINKMSDWPYAFLMWSLMGIAMMVPTIQPTLKTFGEHPTEKKNITAHDGKFGPYVKCGKINASILGDQTIDSLKLEDAIRLIDERKAKMGLKKKKKN